ncbi:hypothetical protein [Mesorhizobium sp.]|uniref:hypothetical protein n=1 Tax=Mesorhizobium sp. TaxID=1871066 RepID=UPI000FE69CB4|nr:hypothetical protein [Mesorhizobium sp.]RWQ61319.1 MAG: hypothetical protein EOS83_04125 [Mesorhizobium sp.]
MINDDPDRLVTVTPAIVIPSFTRSTRMFYHEGFASDAVMSPGIFFCFEDQALEQALEQTQARRVRHLPVLNRQKRMTGPHLAE